MAERITTVFLNAENVESRSPTPSTVTMQIRYPDFDPIIVTQLHIDNEICAKWHGIKQKLGDKRAGKDAEEGHDQTVALVERLVESANWNLAREGAGPRTSILAAAIVAVLVAAGRIEPDAAEGAIGEKMELCREKEYREKAASRPDVKAEMDKIKATRAAERAAKSATEAGAVETETESL